MATASDVAAYILATQGPMSAMKLQKLVYYALAWHATWDGQTLFDDRVEAWANGPVVPALYRQHRGMFMVNAEDFDGDPDELNHLERENVDIVLSFYGDKSPQYLSDLTHAERPWQKAREGTPPAQRSSEEIPLGTMVEYYSSL